MANRIHRKLKWNFKFYFLSSNQSINEPLSHATAHTFKNRAFTSIDVYIEYRWLNSTTIKLTELAYWQFSKLNVIFAHQIMFALQPFEKRQMRNNEVENHLIHNIQKIQHKKRYVEKKAQWQLDFVISLIKISIEMKMWMAKKRRKKLRSE